MRRGWAIAGCAALTACGGAGGSGHAAKWNVTDACKTLDNAAVTAATGLAVRSAELSGATPAANGGAAMSMCTYTLANGAIMGVMLRTSDTPFSDADIAQMAAILGGSKPVDGLGMKAFWSPGIGSLQVFPDRNSYASLNYRAAMTLPGTPAAPGPDPKTALVATARKLL